MQSESKSKKRSRIHDVGEIRTMWSRTTYAVGPTDLLRKCRVIYKI